MKIMSFITIVFFLFNPNCFANSEKMNDDFLVIISLVPGNWIQDRETDFGKIDGPTGQKSWEE